MDQGSLDENDAGRRVRGTLRDAHSASSVLEDALRGILKWPGAKESHGGDSGKGR